MRKNERVDAEAEYQHISSFHDGGLLSAVWSRCQSRHMLQGGGKGTTGLSGYRTLQEPQEQVPAQELEQQEVQELVGGIRGQQRFAADEEAWDGICRPGAVPHEPVVQFGRDHTANHLEGGDSPGRHVDLVEIKS